MPEFVVNPRRAPRAPARCRAAVLLPSGSFDAVTEDVGGRGCQLVAPRQVARGTPVKLTLSNARLPEALRVAGRVAWSSATAPFRIGVAYEELGLRDAGRWFDRLVAAHPGMVVLRRVPERIPLDATVFLGAPPRFIADFSADEERLLCAVGSGQAIRALVAGFGEAWPTFQRALFSLLAHQHLTLARGGAVHPASWRAVLPAVAEAAASAALRRSSTPIPEPAVAPASPAAPAAPSAAEEAGEAWAQEPALGRGAGFGRAPAPDFRGAGVGWRAQQKPRSAEAQECYDRALAELAAGRQAAALALLRRALALAPGDPEIAAAVGKLAFR